MVPDFVISQVIIQNDVSFKKPFEQALEKISEDPSADFLTVFFEAYSAYNDGMKLNAIFYGEGIEITTPDADVQASLRARISEAMNGIENVMNKRINQFGVAQPNIQKDEANNRLYIELPGVQDERTVAEKLQSTANLEFFETYSFDQIQTNWSEANRLSLQEEGMELDSTEEIS